jgi:hypothetical protein
MHHAPSAFISVLLVCGGALAAAAAETSAPVPGAGNALPAAEAKATVAATYGPSHWLSTAGWKSGPAEHYNPAKIAVPPAAEATARVLQIEYTGGAKDKAAIGHALAKDDTAPHPAFSFTVLNPGERPVQVAIAVKTGKGWTYHESAAQTVPGQGKEPVALVFDLEAPVYKTAATKWQASSAIADLGEIREVQILILNGSFAGQATIADAQIREQTTAAR